MRGQQVQDSFYVYLGSFERERYTYENGGYVVTGFVRSVHGIVGVQVDKQVDRLQNETFHLHLTFGYHRRWIKTPKCFSDRYIITLARRYAAEIVKRERAA